MAKKFGRYNIIKEIGKGGMATVYLAEDPLIGREVAIKVLPKEFLHDDRFTARFHREAQTIAALPARSLNDVSVVWPNVAAGVYTVGVTVDAGDVITESNEENNQSVWSLLVARCAIHLPLVARGK